MIIFLCTSTFLPHSNFWRISCFLWICTFIYLWTLCCSRMEKLHWLYDQCHTISFQIESMRVPGSWYWDRFPNFTWDWFLSWGEDGGMTFMVGDRCQRFFHQHRSVINYLVAVKVMTHLLFGCSKFRKVHWTNSCTIFETVGDEEEGIRVLLARQCNFSYNVHLVQHFWGLNN